MGVRRQCNRYKTEPYGADFNDVLKRAKAFFRDDGEFMICGYQLSRPTVWTSSSVPLPPFSIRSDTRIYKKIGRRWVEIAVNR